MKGSRHLARPDDRCGDSFLLGSHNELFGLNLAARIRSKKIRASQLRVILCDDSAVAVTKQVIHDEGTEIYDAFRFCFLACVENILRPLYSRSPVHLPAAVHRGADVIDNLDSLHRFADLIGVRQVAIHYLAAERL